MSYVEPFTPEGINPDSSYLAICINRVNTNYKITKQDTLTPTTTLLGIGSNITALDYNNIEFNRPTSFPPDMTNIYTKDEVNDILDTKQDTLTSSTNLLGIGSAITTIDYNNITLNKPTYFNADWNSTIINKPNIYTKDESDGRYLQLIGGNMSGPIYIDYSLNNAFHIYNNNSISSANIKFTNSDNISSYIGLAASSYSGNYANNFFIQSPNSIILNSGGSSGNPTSLLIPKFIMNSSGNIGISATDITTYRFNINGSLNATTIYRNGTEIDSRYVKLSGDTMTGNLTLNNSLITNSIIYNNSELSNTLNNCLLKSGGTMTGLLDILIGTDTAIQIRNPTPSSTASMKFTNNNNLTSYLGFGCLSYTGIYANNFYIQSPTSLILNAGGVSGGYTPFFIITSSGKIGISATDLNTYRFNITGSLNATTIYRNGTEIDSRYVKLSGDTMTGQLYINYSLNDALHIYNSSSTSTANIKFTNSGNELSYIGLGSPSYSGSYANNFFIQSPNSIILNSGGTTGAYTSKFIMNSLGNIGISATDLNTYRFNINGSLNATTIYRNGMEIDSRYLLKSGDTMSGTLTINGASGLSHQLILNNNDYSTFPNIKLSAGDVYNGAIGFGGLFSQNYQNNLFLESTGKIILNVNGNSISATPNFIINTNGNVGIGVLNPSTKLDVNGGINATRPVNINFTGYTGNHLLILTNDNTSTYPMIKLTNNTNGDGFIGIGGYYGQNYFGNFFLKATNSLIFNTGANNETNIPNMIILPNGNVGISSLSPTTKLDVNGSIKSTSLTTPSIIYNGTELSNAYLKLSGGTMSGQITGITTLSATTGLFGTLATTNNTNVGAVGIGTYGGTGDKIILYAGSASAYPYSFGINSSELWYCVPNAANHNFYCGGNNIISIYGSTLSRSVSVKGDLIVNSSPSLANQISLSSSLSNANANLLIQNNEGYSCFLGVGGTATTGNYKNNLFITSSRDIIFNTFGRGASATPDMMITSNGNVGIGNPSPSQPLWIGRPDVASEGAIVVSKNTGGNRNFMMKYDPSYNFSFGDYGNVNGANSFTSQFSIHYNAPENCITVNTSGNVGIGVASANCKLDVRGIANITNTNPSAVPNGRMQAGSLTIGDASLDYGNNYYSGPAWTGNNTAGLLMECLDSTEIAIHDAGNRLTSAISYVGGGVNTLKIGRDMGWGSPTSIQIFSKTSIYGEFENDQFYTKPLNQVICKPISVAPPGAGEGINGHWLIDVERYRYAVNYNTVFFSCGWRTTLYNTYYSGFFMFSSEVNTLYFSTPIFQAGISVQPSYDSATSRMYIRVNHTYGANITPSTLLTYKIIG